MKRLSFAIAAATALTLTACSGTNDDAVNDSDVNASVVDESNSLDTDLANDAANEAEAESLRNQAAQLADESNASANADVPATGTDDEAMNVSGM
ncbi:MAG: hypothetical protein ACJ8EY_02085 [Sphingomicrobium sp.]